jgi:osmotically-inducible protein OsmY
MDLAHAIDALRRTPNGDYDERYRQLQVQVRGDVVYLRGSVRQWEDALGLARAISRLPGVEQVLLKDLEVSR